MCRLIAATYVMNYYELHDLETNYEALQHCFDSIVAVTVDQKMSCEQIAKFTNLSLDELRFLNPGLRCSVIPALDVPYSLKLPSNRTSVFDEYRDSIVHYSADARIQYYYGATGAGRVYVVRKGDNLGKIAARYHVSVSQIKKWNHLSSSVIRPGQKLKIYSSRYEEPLHRHQVQTRIRPLLQHLPDLLKHHLLKFQAAHNTCTIKRAMAIPFGILPESTVLR